jgi:hypothetical protein
VFHQLSHNNYARLSSLYGRDQSVSVSGYAGEAREGKLLIRVNEGWFVSAAEDGKSCTRTFGRIRKKTIVLLASNSFLWFAWERAIRLESMCEGPKS